VILPAYQSHKVVHAAKIVSIGKPTGQITNLVLKLPGGEEVNYGVLNDYVPKHNPQVGGYLVVYEDGYESWSPDKAFEEGYTLVEAAPPGSGGAT
jgi:hypothetical protein